jgi:quercetin dioxygenase-like cupin family protein
MRVDMMQQIVSFKPQSRSVQRAFASRVEDIVPLDTVPGEQISVCVRGADVGGAYTILQSLIIPGSSVPMHVHHNEDEVFHIIEGCLRFQVAKAEFDALPGTTVVIPKGALHGWRNLTDARVVALVIFSPGGIDQMFKEIAGRSLAEIDVIARRHGTFVVGPMIDAP